MIDKTPRRYSDRQCQEILPLIPKRPVPLTANDLMKSKRALGTVPSPGQKKHPVPPHYFHLSRFEEQRNLWVSNVTGWYRLLETKHTYLEWIIPNRADERAHTQKYIYSHFCYGT